ncbi:MAG: type II secretion system protein J [Planctomycetota bacterium]
MSVCTQHAIATRRAGERGFTLIELLVVMGILTGFLLMLTQLVDSGLTMFREGESGQQMADRASKAQRVLQTELSRLRGSIGGRERAKADDRFVVQMLPVGLPSQPERDASRVQMVRGAVHLDPERELSIMHKLLLPDILREQPELDGEELTAEVERRKRGLPLRGVGNLMLLPWRQEGGDAALVEVRAGWFLPEQMFPVGPDRLADPFEVMEPGSGDLPGMLVYETTEPILQDLLHCEFLLWSQQTTSWGDDRGPLQSFPEAPPSGEPLGVWDSARGGWLIDARGGGVFPLDAGPDSEDDPSDDVHPHAILVRCVVAAPADGTPEGVLDGALSPDDSSLGLYNGAAFPGRDENGFVKLGGEWIRYARRDGDRLIGLRRGQRGTKAIEHDDQIRVHVGRTVEFVVPILHHKDDWNHGGGRAGN